MRHLLTQGEMQWPGFIMSERYRLRLMVYISLMKTICLHANPMNIIVRFDYVNKENKHNITLASLVVSEAECSISFNGYIIVKREF